MALAVQIKGLDKFIADVKKEGMDIKPLVNATIFNSAQKVQSNVRELAPHRTGTLQRSVLIEKQNLSATVKVNEKYGEYIEKGTGIYGESGQRIEPKSKKALAFTVGGMGVVVRSIKGMKAKPFFKPGVERSEEYINQQFTKLIERIVRGLAGH